jgi:hypothetical protein
MADESRAMPRRRDHHHVYVVELSKEVLLESRFRRANPQYVAGKPCVYVGMTGLDPDLRFDKHKAGIQSNRYVTEYDCGSCPISTRDSIPCPTRRRASAKWK